MQCDTDKVNNKTNLPVDLRNIALDKGFTISDNYASGNCMFYALSDQLESVKEIQTSHRELRKTVVQFLTENTNMVGLWCALIFFSHFLPETHYSEPPINNSVNIWPISVKFCHGNGPEKICSLRYG